MIVYNLRAGTIIIMDNCAICSSVPVFLCSECKGTGKGILGDCAWCNGKKNLCKTCNPK